MRKGSLYRIEKKKMKGRKIGMVVAGVMVVQFLWLMICFRPPLTDKDLLDGYYLTLVNMPVLDTIFFPLLMAMIASRLCEVEHKGSNLKLLYTLMDRKKLFDIKLLMGIRYISLIALLQIAMIFAAAKIAGFTGKILWLHILWAAVSAALMNLSLFLMQEILSFWFENQMIPLAIGLFGSFFGLFSLFVQQVRSGAFYSYYLLLTMINMDWDEKTRITTFYEMPFPVGKLATVLVVTIILYGLGKWVIIQKKEV